MLRVNYEPIMSEDGTRKVFVNGTYFTVLRMNKANKLLLADKEHPLVDLVKLFEAAEKCYINYGSFRDVLITIEAP